MFNGVPFHRLPRRIALPSDCRVASGAAKFPWLVVSLVNASNLQNRRLDSLKSVTAEHQLQYVWSEVEIQTESLDIPSLPDLIIHLY